MTSVSSELHDDLLARAHTLLADLDAYEECLQNKKRQDEVEIGHFKRNVLTETRRLEKQKTAFNTQGQHDPSGEDIHKGHGLELNFDDPYEQRAATHSHALRSSNLSFYEAVWSVAKQCKAVTAFSKKCYMKGSKDRIGVLVDVIACDGQEWIKVSTISAKRLLFQIAKEGWAVYADALDSESDAEVLSTGSRASSDDHNVGLVKLAKGMRRIAQSTRVHYQHPRVHFILPNLTEGQVDEIDSVIASLRDTGVTVRCGHEWTRHSPEDHNSNVHKRESFDLVLPSVRPCLTETLNIDCTVLLALMSDISHVLKDHLPTAPTHHSAITKQIEFEVVSPLLPNEIYPVIQGRRLVCTRLAAQRVREIVETMGTETELMRADIVLTDGRTTSECPEELRKRYGSLSTHSVPNELLLPIEVVDYERGASVGAINNHYKAVQQAGQISRTIKFSSINESVFLHGWNAEIVTVTSNRAVAVALEKAINFGLDEAEERGERYQLPDYVKSSQNSWPGPKVWICEPARSLIGKEKHVKRA